MRVIAEIGSGDAAGNLIRVGSVDGSTDVHTARSGVLLGRGVENRDALARAGRLDFRLKVGLVEGGALQCALLEADLDVFRRHGDDVGAGKPWCSTFPCVNND